MPPPQGLEAPRLRSSLRKTNYAPSATNSRGRSSGNGGGSGGGTPTNPTPPDSTHSEDSSYVSAKETSSSQHSGASAPRVRFSPVAASLAGDGRTLIDMPVLGQSQDLTMPLKVPRLFSSPYQTLELERLSQAARPARRDLLPSRSKSALTELHRDFV